MVIIFKKVTKSFGSIKALDDVSFEVKKGEFVFLTGHSAAGKTTLLRLITKEYSPDSGQIIFDGHDITNLPQSSIPLYRQKIGTVFQDFKIIPERTVRENVEVVLAVAGIDQKEWKEKINHVLKQVGLEKRAELFPSQLSGGEIQRLSLARAVAIEPKLILADEPTGNLDWDTAVTIMDLLEKINSEGKTILMATHNEMIVKKYGKRIIKLEGGKII